MGRMENPQILIEDYCTRHSDTEPLLLQALARETRLKATNPRMISGAYQGRFLALLSKLLQPKRILEIGTFTGYSALCLAEGLASAGHLTTLEVNPELSALAKKYWAEAGLTDHITQHIGDAKALVPGLQQTWDLVFIDAKKEEYLNYYELVLPQLRPGGVILTDNVLWDGKVVDKSMTDIATLALRRFNTFVAEDERVERVLLPIRDGLTIIRKK